MPLLMSMNTMLLRYEGSIIHAREHLQGQSVTTLLPRESASLYLLHRLGV
jgi:hypothetical protein